MKEAFVVLLVFVLSKNGFVEERILMVSTLLD